MLRLLFFCFRIHSLARGPKTKVAAPPLTSGVCSRFIRRIQYKNLTKVAGSYIQPFKDAILISSYGIASRAPIREGKFRIRRDPRDLCFRGARTFLRTRLAPQPRRSFAAENRRCALLRGRAILFLHCTGRRRCSPTVWNDEPRYDWRLRWPATPHWPQSPCPRSTARCASCS